MTGAATVTKQPCGSCPGGHCEVTIPVGLGVGDVMQAMYDAADAHRETHATDPVHIRRREPRGWVNTTNPNSDRRTAQAAATLCGAAPGGDITWAEARHAKNLAYVTCEDCKRRRAAGEGAR